MTAVERTVATARIAEAVEPLFERFAAGATVALYAAKGTEVETTAIDAALRAKGFVVVYPRVVDADRVLAFHVARADELVMTSRYALREPVATQPSVAVADIAAFFVPGVAFDREGGRLGWGRGHYDATLAAAKPDALRIGLAFECQVVERVEREAHDAPMHVIVTEVATHVV
jgi:5-formyltetrahydrofolate cyclo-ligase